MSIETYKTEKQTEKKNSEEKEWFYLRTLGKLQKVQHMHNGNMRRRKRERNKRDIWNNNDWEFPWVNVREQTTDPGSSEGTMQDKCPPPTNYTYTYHFQTKEYQR